MAHDQEASSPTTFYNPIVPRGQDPFMIFHDKIYHLLQSEDGKRIVLYQSERLTNINKGTRTLLWEAPMQGVNCCDVWAPEMFFINSRWYIYYAADAGENTSHRMFVLESQGSDPKGPYHEKGKISDPTDNWAIDGTILQYLDSFYFVWSGWSKNINIQQNLYIASMSNPWTINGQRILLSEPTFDWEKPITGPAINEGPQFLQHNNKVYLVYSANGSWTDDYCLGLLSLTSDELLNPRSWVKTNHPIFSKAPAASVFGPGHCSFVESPDRTENWIIYHANEISGSSWGGRSIRAQKYAWNLDGTPNFGTPVPIQIELSKPSGEK